MIRDAIEFCQCCDQYQKTENISKKNEIIFNFILEVELFDLWDIEFMGSFPPSHENLYILLAIDYVFKWVEEIVCSSNDGRIVIEFLKRNIFAQFGVSRTSIVMKDHIL